MQEKGGGSEEEGEGRGSLWENPFLFPVTRVPGGRIFSNKGVTVEGTPSSTQEAATGPTSLALNHLSPVETDLTSPPLLLLPPNLFLRQQVALAKIMQEDERSFSFAQRDLLDPFPSSPSCFNWSFFFFRYREFFADSLRIYIELYIYASYFLYVFQTASPYCRGPRY